MCSFQLLVKDTACVLKASVTMEDWMRTRVFLQRFVKGLEYQGIIVPVTKYIGNDSAVTQVKDCTQVNLVYCNPFIPFEFCNICEPFLVEIICMEITIYDVFCKELGILGMARTAIVGVLIAIPKNSAAS